MAINFKTKMKGYTEPQSVSSAAAASSTAPEHDAPYDGVDDAWYTGNSAYDGIECKNCGEDALECYCTSDRGYPDESF